MGSFVFHYVPGGPVRGVRGRQNETERGAAEVDHGDKAICPDQKLGMETKHYGLCHLRPSATKVTGGALRCPREEVQGPALGGQRAESRKTTLN